MDSKAFQTLSVIPENIGNASRFGPGFTIGGDRGEMIRSEHKLLTKIASMACGLGTAEALSKPQAEKLVARVQALQGTSPEDLISHLQAAGDDLLDAILNGEEKTVIDAAYLETMIHLLALSQ